MHPDPATIAEGVARAVADAARRNAVWFARQGGSTEAASRHFERAKVRSYPRTWSNTSAMWGGMGGAVLTTTQVTVVWPGGNVPAFCYQDGEFVYALDVAGDSMAADWNRSDTPPTRREVERLGHLADPCDP